MPATALLQELSAAARQLRRAPAFTSLAVALLAVGIGINVAIFSVFRSIVLQPLPFAQSERLAGFSAVQPAKALTMPALSASDFRDLHERASSFQALAAFRPNFISYRPATGGDAVQLVGALVTEDFFSLYGIAPLRGRVFQPGEFSLAAPRTAVLSRAAWRRHFGERADIIGATLLLDDEPTTIVGIMPEEFREPEFVEVWLPFPAEAPENLARDSRYWTTVGRLKAGVALSAAQAEVATLAADLASAYPSTNRGWSLTLTPLLEQRVGGLRRSLLLLAGAVGLVLLVACINLANLLLARGVGRLPEWAVRLALGASPGALARGVLLESLLLGIAGGALGAAAATIGLPLLAARLPAGLVPRSHAIAVDGQALMFAVVVSLLCGAAFGLLPAWHVRRANVNDVLKSGGSRSGTSRFASRAQGALVTTQIALTIVVLSAAGLLARSLLNLQHTAPGFDAQDVLTLRVAPPQSRWADFVGLSAYYDRLAAAARSVPGVEAAAFDCSAPLCGISLRYPFWVKGRPADDGNVDDAVFNAVTPDFLSTLRLPLQRGRWLARTDDRAAPKVCVINRALAQRMFPGVDPIGQRLRIVPWLANAYREIVGVVGDVRQDNLADPPPPQIYVPQAQSPWFFSTLLVRARGGAARLAEIQAALRRADPAIALTFRTLDDNIARTTTQPRLRTLLFALFAGGALGVSAFGIYAGLDFTVRQRTREIGVRLALGATPRSILGWTLARAGRWCLTGVSVGLPAALTCDRLLRGLLNGVEPGDPFVLGALALGVPAIALLACVPPALGAARLNPTRALQRD